MKHNILTYKNASKQLGTLLLDSLTAIAILAIVFAVTFPNYQRATQQAEVGVDAQQLEAISTAVILYENDHKGQPPETTNSGVTTTMPGSNYLAVVPLSPMSQFPLNSYEIGTGISPTNYVIIDYNAITDPTLFTAYKEVTGTACNAGDYFAYDIVHGLYCATSSTG